MIDLLMHPADSVSKHSTCVWIGEAESNSLWLTLFYVDFAEEKEPKMKFLVVALLLVLLQSAHSKPVSHPEKSPRALQEDYTYLLVTDFLLCQMLSLLYPMLLSWGCSSTYFTCELNSFLTLILKTIHKNINPRNNPKFFTSAADFCISQWAYYSCSFGFTNCRYRVECYLCCGCHCLLHQVYNIGTQDVNKVCSENSFLTLIGNKTTDLWHALWLICTQVKL